MAPQSGHCQVIPLHVSPHMFSSMHSEHIWNPQEHVQQNGTFLPQQQQTYSFFRLFLFIDVFFLLSIPAFQITQEFTRAPYGESGRRLFEKFCFNQHGWTKFPQPPSGMEIHIRCFCTIWLYFRGKLCFISHIIHIQN